MDKPLKEAMEVLRDRLINHQDYYYAWKCNLAMAFKDEFAASWANDSVHNIANNAADRFLRMLTFKNITDAKP